MVCTLSLFFSTTAFAQTCFLGETKISFEQAIEIAATRVGGGTVVEIVWELKYGQPVCKIEVNNNGGRHEIRIDPATGEITKLKSK